MRSGALKIVAGLAGLAAIVPASARAALPAGVYEVRSIETARFGVPHPTTLSAVRGGHLLQVAQRRAGGDVVRRVSLTERLVGRGGPAGRARSSAFDPSSGLRFALRRRSLRVTDPRRGARTTLSLRALRLADARALAVARTGDNTDDPAARSVYIVDRGRGRERPGRIVELGFEHLSGRASVVQEVQATYVRSISTAAYSPSSPDPSGIVYLADRDQFLIADSEVEEMPIYKGANLFTTARGATTGSGTGTTVAFSKEPSGLGYNPASGTLYVSDDDADRVTVDRAGADGRHGTADDSWTRFSTGVFGSYDPEAVEYDPATGHLWICDGTGLEIFHVDPVDGTFGNGNDTVSHFDTQAFGMRDCEGLGIDPVRETLLAVDPSRRKIYEFTKSGSLSRIVDLNQIPTDNRMPSSATLAPTSSPNDDPRALSLWVTDRHVDNGVDPNENDGLLHELLLPGQALPPDAPPSATLTQPGAGATVSGTVTIAASATDDVGVSSVRFAVDGVTIGTDANGSDGWSVQWDTTSVANGSRVLEAVATDTSGNPGASAPVTVTVSNQLQKVVRLPVATGADDASELSSTGQVNRSNGDIELGSDLGVPTTVGLRFSGVPIPRGAVIARASIQFTADELNRAAASLTLRAQAADSAGAFSSVAYNVSSRPAGAASVLWSPPTWTVLGETGPGQRTPDIARLVQEVINRPGWSAGNAIVVLATGTGRRTAESFEGGFPPTLTVEFSTP
jgi:hypothetical protein